MKIAPALNPDGGTVPVPPARARVKLKQGGTDYVLLIVIVLAVALSANAGPWAQGTWDGRSVATQFMGVLLVIFALPKLLDLRGFADGFQMYDFIGKRCRTYALIYPFIELGLGLALQIDFYPLLTNAILLVVMLIGVTGILLALGRGLNVASDNLRTSISLPLSTVALVVGAGMVVMATGLLFMGFV